MDSGESQKAKEGYYDKIHNVSNDDVGKDHNDSNDDDNDNFKDQNDSNDYH